MCTHTDELSKNQALYVTASLRKLQEGLPVRFYHNPGCHLRSIL